ncbi:MAG: cysteine desulfurase [Rhodospirillaceae bacterium]|nr:cysteine desulfurase [Rhodospirillaceae bacterium]
MAAPVYLDYNATAPLRPAARAALESALAETGNASSVHGPGRAARARIEAAREQVARLVEAAAEGVVFTSGGTEANNLALAGCGRARVLVSAVEHDSVLRAAPDAEILPVTAEGVVDLAALEAALRRDGRPALVSLMLANNETGVIQPVAEAAAIARAHGALVHCDAVQAAGRIPVSLPGLGVDLLSLSAHKLGGPQGAGALVLRDGVELSPLLRGGGQERYRRAGTENVPGIAGFGAAADEAAAEPEVQGRVAALRDTLEAGLRAAEPSLVVFGAGAPRLPNTCCFAVPGLSAETLLIALDLAGVAASSGSACSSGKVRPSHVLAAMGVPPALARGAIRISLGWASRRADVERFLEAWRALPARRRSALPAA